MKTKEKTKKESSCSNKTNDLIENDENFELLASFFYLFSDPTRLKIIELLKENELCVHELSNILKIKQPSISQHLKVLYQGKILQKKKLGLHVFYKLDDEHIARIYEQGLEHVKE